MPKTTGIWKEMKESEKREEETLGKEIKTK